MPQPQPILEFTVDGDTATISALVDDLPKATIVAIEELGYEPNGYFLDNLVRTFVEIDRIDKSSFSHESVPERFCLTGGVEPTTTVHSTLSDLIADSAALTATVRNAIPNPNMPLQATEDYLIPIFDEMIPQFREERTNHSNFVRLAKELADAATKKKLIERLRPVAEDPNLGELSRSVFGMLLHLGAKDLDVTAVVDEIDKYKDYTKQNPYWLIQADSALFYNSIHPRNFDQFNRFLKMDAESLVEQQEIFINYAAKKKQFREDPRFAWLLESRYVDADFNFLGKAMQKIRDSQTAPGTSNTGTDSANVAGTSEADTTLDTQEESDTIIPVYIPITAKQYAALRAADEDTASDLALEWMEEESTGTTVDIDKGASALATALSDPSALQAVNGHTALDNGGELFAASPEETVIMAEALKGAAVDDDVVDDLDTLTEFYTNAVANGHGVVITYN